MNSRIFKKMATIPPQMQSAQPIQGFPPGMIMPGVPVQAGFPMMQGAPMMMGGPFPGMAQ